MAANCGPEAAPHIRAINGQQLDSLKMDKRKKRTSYQQYVIYLKMLEEDAIFRTGIIPRDVELNYLSKKWEQLAEKLNCCGHGPILSADEWKKRLNDWKNSTRAKFRKCQAEQIKQSDRSEFGLTPLEERALLLWGPLSTKSLCNVSNEQSTTYILPENHDVKPTELISIKADTSEILIEPVSLPTLTPITQEVQSTATIAPAPSSPTQHQTPVVQEVVELIVTEEEKEPKRRRLDSEEDQTFGMLKMKPSISTQDIKSIATELRRLADIKEEKLKFEIAKFRFRNPGFEYNYTSTHTVSDNDDANDSSATCDHHLLD